MSDPWPPRPPEGPPAEPSAGAPTRPGPRADGGPSSTPGPDNPSPARGASGMSRNRRALSIAILVAVVLLVVATLAAGPVAAPGAPTFPPAGSTTGPAGASAATTRGVVAAALAAQGLQVADATSAYRPAEAARMAAAPRIVIRAVMAGDPDHGQLVIYEFRDPGTAASAAHDQAAYVSSGVGRVQFPLDTRFSLRVVGSNVVFYAWSPANALHPDQAAAVATALGTVGFDVPVPN